MIHMVVTEEVDDCTLRVYVLELANHSFETNTDAHTHTEELLAFTTTCNGLILTVLSSRTGP